MTDRAGPQRRRLIILVVVVIVVVAILGSLRFTGNDDDDEPTTGPAVAPTLNLAEVPRDIPPPEACTIAPRSVEAIQAIIATPVSETGVATPEASPAAGEPADPEIVAAVTATFRQAIACRNAGDFARAFALYTDSYTRLLVLGAAQASQIDPAIVAVVVATPRATSPMEWDGIQAIGAVDRLPDGRVVAFVVTKPVGPSGAGDGVPQLVYFVEVDGRWLIDGIYDAVPTATPAP